MTLAAGTYTFYDDVADPLGIELVYDGSNWSQRNASVSDIDFTTAGVHTVYYVDYQNGNDANNGLTPATAVQTFDQAWTLAIGVSPQSNIEIVLLDEWIGVQSLTTTAKTLGASVKVRSASASGRTIITNKDEDVTISWSDNGDGTFSASSNVEDYPACFDNAAKDADGIAAPMQSVGSGAACASTAGSFYWDGVDTLMVHMTDDREPDDDFIYCPASPLGRMSLYTASATGVVILENLTCYHNGGAAGGGGGFNARCQASSGPGYNTAKLGMKSCFSAGSNSNGFGILDFQVCVLEGCVTKYNRGDGFNYHAVESTTAGRYMTVYEVNSKSEYCGYDGVFQDQPARQSNSNGSTAHDSMTIIRINCNHTKTYGPCIADVNGCDSWNFGVFAENPGLPSAGANNAAFYHQATAVTAETHRMLLFACDGSANSDGDGAVMLSGDGDFGVVGHADWQGPTVTSDGTVFQI